MADKIHYSSAARVRKRAHNVNKLLYSDGEINDIIDRISLNMHTALGRSTSSIWTTADAEFKTIQTAVLYGSACEILGGLDELEEAATLCRQQFDQIMESLTEKGGTVPRATAHFDLIDGLDPTHYGQQFS